MGISKKTIERIFYDSNGDASKFFSNFGDSVVYEFSGIRIIGQIERSEGKDTYRCLKQCLKKICKPFKNLETVLDETQVIQKRFRAVMSLYFVWTGTFSYGKDDGNEFWPHIFDGLSINYKSNKCGQIFIECLEENGLETFDEVKGGFPYVTKILLHGLIPDIHLSNFIENLIVPEFENIRGGYLDGGNVIKKLQHNNKLEYQPKTIERFIKYGRPVNVQILDKFWDMVKGWNGNGQSSWWQWGLPKYMVDAFGKWADNPSLSHIKQTKQETFGGRPYLLFDFERDCPLLVIPPQKITKKALLKFRYTPLGEFYELEEEQRIGSIALGNTRFSEETHIEISHSEEWHIGIGGKTLTVNYEFPVCDSGSSVPLYLFNARTGKPVRDVSKNCPKELIIVYPSDAEVKLKGGKIITESIPLRQKWDGWQYISCELEQISCLLYEGPNIRLKDEITETISLQPKDSEHSKPELEGNGIAPSWIRSVDEWPVITNIKKIEIKLNLRKYVAGELVRLGSDNETAVRVFRISENKDKILFPADINLNPGTYRVCFRGTIGTDDAILHFIYLPLTDCERFFNFENQKIADRFRVCLSTKIPFEPTDNTKVFQNNSQQIDISLKKDNGDAYCALKFFPKSLCPITLLFARSDIRWVRHADEGRIRWERWRSKTETISVPRLEELEKNRLTALVEIDQIPNSLAKKLQKKNNKLRLIFESDDIGNKPVSVMSDEVPNYKRKSRIWLVRLDKFSDQLKSSLRGLESASLRPDHPDYKDFTLFTLLRKPEFKNFRIRSEQIKGDSETLTVNWTYQANDPRKNRVLRFYPSDNPEKPIKKTIPDNDLPPVKAALSLPQKPEMWTVEIDVQASRFGFNRSSSGGSLTHAQWLRIPPRWSDWVHWHDLSFRDIQKKIPEFQSLPSKIRTTALIWSDFLHLFHCGNDESSYQRLKKILGDSLIRRALPFSAGKIWQVRNSGKNCCLRLRVHSSMIDFPDFTICFANCKPYEWYKIPEHITFRLALQNSHKYLGDRDSVWKCHSLPKFRQPVMTSDTGQELDFPYWLKNAVNPSKKCSVIADIPFEELWNNPPQLPIITKFNLKDHLFYIDRVVNKGKTETAMGSAFAEAVSRNGRDSQPNEKAAHLLKQWENWSEKGVNPLLQEVIKSRLNNSQTYTLTGATAFIIRLKANGHERSIFKGVDLNEKRTQKLLAETLDFVSEYLPKAFLRDLILSEILINWYWNKSIVSI